MRKLLSSILVLMLLFAITPTVHAHPGRTDSNGGHYCWTNCAKWGLKYGQYHYHYGGGSSSYSHNNSSTKYYSGGGSSSYSNKSNNTKSTSKPKPQSVQLITPDVYINGKKQNYDQKAYIKNGTTLVPMRPIFEALGAKVHWDGSTQKVTAIKGNTLISLTIGNKKGYVKENNVTRSVELSHPAEIKNGRTMVPLRFVSESLGANVQWDSSTQTVKINQ